MNKPRISYLAIFSLVAGMAFYIPLFTGFVAVLLGLFAVRAIRKSEGTLLGSGVAYTGATLGAIHGVFWALVFFAGLTYTVEEGDSAVVSRFDDVVRVEEAGWHYKIPFIETIAYYPTTHLNSLSESAGSLLFATKESHPIGFQILWKVCSPEKTHNKYHEFTPGIIERRISLSVTSQLRHLAATKSSPTELISDIEGTSLIESKVNNELNAQGICVELLNLTNGK